MISFPLLGRDGATFAKLFVGSVPRTATEDDVSLIRDMFSYLYLVYDHLRTCS